MRDITQKNARMHITSQNVCSRTANSCKWGEKHESGMIRAIDRRRSGQHRRRVFMSVLLELFSCIGLLQQPWADFLVLILAASPECPLQQKSVEHWVGTVSRGVSTWGTLVLQRIEGSARLSRKRRCAYGASRARFLYCRTCSTCWSVLTLPDNALCRKCIVEGTSVPKIYCTVDWSSENQDARMVIWINRAECLTEPATCRPNAPFAFWVRSSASVGVGYSALNVVTAHTAGNHGMVV